MADQTTREDGKGRRRPKTAERSAPRLPPAPGSGDIAAIEARRQAAYEYARSAAQDLRETYAALEAWQSEPASSGAPQPGARVSGRVADLLREHAKLRAERDEAKSELGRARVELDAAKRGRADVEHALNETRRSVSWRVTKPLRALSRVLRRSQPGPPAAPGSPSRAESATAETAVGQKTFDVIFLIGCWEGESKRYRVYNVAEALSAEGLSIRVMDFSERQQIIDKRLSARVLVIFRAPFLDMAGVEQLIDYARRDGMRVVFDVDDLVFEPDLVSFIHGVKELSQEQQAEYARGVQMYRRMLLACDMATVTTEPLKLAVEKLGKPVAVIPNCLNATQVALAESLRAGRKANRVARVGYFPGSRTHQRDFAEAEAALLELMRERNDWELLLVGYLDLGPAWSPYLGRVKRKGFQPYLDMLRLLSECDVNIAPLESGDLFSGAKSELKFFEAGLVATPSICSPTEPFAAVIENGVNGYLAQGRDQWKAALAGLLDSPGLRRRIGEAAMRTSLERFGPKANAAAARAVLLPATEDEAPPPPAGARSIRIDWIVPRLIVGGGGHRNILRAAHHLQRFGHDVHLHFMNSDDQGQELGPLIRRHFYDFRGGIGVYDGVVRDTDVVMATHWTTVDPALRASAGGAEVMYFVQDFEPAFAPMGSEYVMAENTYRQGLYCITSGPWCERILKRDFGCEADHFLFPIDTAVYRPRMRTRTEQNIIFFAKPEMPRRCFELGVWALEKFHRLRPDVKIIMFGSKSAKERQVGFPAEYLEIVPTIDDLAQLYADADLGLAFSTTNPSLVPYEMMASGCPVVDLGRAGNEFNYDGRTDIALLADPRPDAMAKEIAALLADTEQLTQRRENGLAFVSTFPDELGMSRRVESLILGRLDDARGAG